jgi:alpha-beta hydrolase superfamily lysophospholipase
VHVPDVLRAEHFLPYFASQGYDAYALSLRGTSKSPDPSGAVGTQSIHLWPPSLPMQRWVGCLGALVESPGYLSYSRKCEAAC